MSLSGKFRAGTSSEHLHEHYHRYGSDSPRQSHGALTPPNSATRSPTSPGLEALNDGEHFAPPPFPLLEIDEQLRDFGEEIYFFIDQELEDEVARMGAVVDTKSHLHDDRNQHISLERGRSPEQTTSHRRPSSVPARPLKSALASPVCVSPSSEHSPGARRKRKSARFKDDSRPTSQDFSLRRTTTAPPATRTYEQGFESRTVAPITFVINQQSVVTKSPWWDDEASGTRAMASPERLVVDVKVDVVHEYEDREDIESDNEEYECGALHNKVDDDLPPIDPELPVESAAEDDFYLRDDEEGEQSDKDIAESSSSGSATISEQSNEGVRLEFIMSTNDPETMDEVETEGMARSFVGNEDDPDSVERNAAMEATDDDESLALRDTDDAAYFFNPTEDDDAPLPQRTWTVYNDREDGDIIADPNETFSRENTGLLWYSGDEDQEDRPAMDASDDEETPTATSSKQTERFQPSIGHETRVKALGEHSHRGAVKFEVSDGDRDYISKRGDPFSDDNELSSHVSTEPADFTRNVFEEDEEAPEDQNEDGDDDDEGAVVEVSITAEEGELLDSLVTGNTDVLDRMMQSNYRRSSEPRIQREQQYYLTPSGYFRRASMTDFIHLKKHIHLPPRFPKADPAEPVLTDCSVHIVEPPLLSSVTEESSSNQRCESAGKRVVTTSQTVRSGTSTYQMVWEDSSDEGDSRFENAGSHVEPDEDDGLLLPHVSRGPSPMKHVQTKLAEWSWAREQDDDDDETSRWIPLMAVDDYRHCRYHSESGDYPLAPPNTKNVSGASSARHSAPRSPMTTDPVEEEEPQFELAFEVTFSQPEEDDALENVGAESSRLSSDHLTPVPGSISRSLSNLPEEDEHFRTHRNSVELARRKLADHHHKGNPELMATRDSFLLTRSKYDSKYPKHTLTGNAKAGARTGLGNLSPIMDASPPELGRFRTGLQAAERTIQEATSPLGLQEQTRHHLGGHNGCSVCGQEKSKRHETAHRGKKQ